MRPKSFLFILLPLLISATFCDQWPQDYKKWAGKYRCEGMTSDDPYEYDPKTTIQELTLDTLGKFKFYDNYAYVPDASWGRGEIYKAGRYFILSDSSIRLDYFKEFKSFSRLTSEKSKDSIINMTISFFDADDTMRPLTGRKLSVYYDFNKQAAGSKSKFIQLNDTLPVVHFKIPAGNDLTSVFVTASDYEHHSISGFPKKNARDYSLRVYLYKNPYLYPGYDGALDTLSTIFIMPKENAAPSRFQWTRAFETDK